MKYYILLIAVFLFSSCNTQTDFTNAPSGVPKDVLKEDYGKVLEKYDSIGFYNNGIAVVIKNNKQGIIDYKGKMHAECLYDSLGIVSLEYVIAKKQDKYGIIDKDGSIIKEFQYNKINYQERIGEIPSLYFVLKDKWGVLDSVGIERIPCMYDKIIPKVIYDEESPTLFFIIQKNKLAGICDFNHKTLLDVNYDGILIFHNRFGFIIKNGKWGVINNKLHIVAECIYDNASFPEESSCDYITVRKGTYKHGKSGIIETVSGRVVVPLIYNKLGNYSNEYPILAKNDNNKFGFIDINNNIVIPFEYDDAKDFSEGFAYVAKYKGYATLRYGGETVRTLKSGFINKDGKIVIPLKFADNTIQEPYFKEGLAPIGIDINNISANLLGYINTKGEFVIKPQFQDANPFKNGVASVVIDDKVGIIDKNGDFIIPPIYDYTWDNQNYSIGDSIIKLKKNNKVHLFKLDGAAI